MKSVVTPAFHVTAFRIARALPSTLSNKLKRNSRYVRTQNLRSFSSLNIKVTGVGTLTPVINQLKLDISELSKLTRQRSTGKSLFKFRVMDIKGRLNSLGLESF